MIPYGRQDITEEDIRHVVDVLKSDFLTQGPAIPLFEKKLAAMTGAKHAFAVNSATSALHVAYMALGLGPGDCVWTSPVTFVATTNAALYCGADVDFVDIEPNTFNMCPDKLEEKLAAAQKSGKLPKIVTPVHLSGLPCDMDRIKSLSVTYGFKIVEDASHAIGATYLEEKTGACTYSDICVFSFHPVKLVTTGEGGALTTNSPELAQRIEMLRTHGITRSPELLKDKSQGAWHYEQQLLGFNYRMTDFQAALGSSQIDRLQQYISKRAKLFDHYLDELRGLPISLPVRTNKGSSAMHLFVIRLHEHSARRRVFDALRQAQILVNLHYIPVYRQPYYQSKWPGRWNGLPQAEQYYASAISLPLYPTLAANDQGFVIEKLREQLQ
jgi:UDP-4-amino-4,6-dideoxy-N-acetyl-beta-L-altrosamine transaminase